MFPKPNVSQNRKRKRELRRLRRSESHNSVLTRDGYRCQDKHCACHRSTAPPILDWHHILGKRPYAPELDDPKFGITLCRLLAHDRATNGYTGSAGWVSPAEYMIEVLESHESEPGFPWAEALAKLRCRAKNEAVMTEREERILQLEGAIAACRDALGSMRDPVRREEIRNQKAGFEEELRELKEQDGE